MSISVMILFGSFVVFVFTAEDPAEPVYIKGLCNENCMVKSCRIYKTGNEFDSGPCSCYSKNNSDNMTTLFCSNFETKEQSNASLVIAENFMIVSGICLLLSVVCCLKMHQLIPFRDLDSTVHHYFNHNHLLSNGTSGEKQTLVPQVV
jgi:hypothetical protein